MQERVPHRVTGSLREKLGSRRLRLVWDRPLTGSLRGFGSRQVIYGFINLNGFLSAPTNGFPPGAPISGFLAMERVRSPTRFISPTVRHIEERIQCAGYIRTDLFLSVVEFLQFSLKYQC